MDIEALWLTLKLAASTTAILLAIALPLAWWIASGRGVARVDSGCGRASAGPSPHGAWVLSARFDGAFDMAGTVADEGLRSSVGVQF
jgi:hypothetical protein